MKIGGETANKAFEDFKQYLSDIGMIHERQNLQLVKMAFLHGFAAAETNEVEAAPAVSVDNKVITQNKPKKARGVLRTYKERQTHARLVASVLQTANRPLQLMEITKLVNESGANWNPSSATGFVLDAMTFNPCIKKVGYGVYQYEQ
jgi:hypothetical protein